MAAVTVAVGTVTYQASAAETTAPASSDVRAVAVPIIPEAIRPPAGSIPIGAYVVASGTQTYTCVDAAGFPAASTPEAQLIGTGGAIHHFAGPSWQSRRDKSLVTATKTASSKRAGTIDELLLTVNSRSGHGILEKANFINRLFTSGGTAPAGPCEVGAKVSVPYKAVYVFWDDPKI
ncbi:MAG TPA: DUF3455 domain-containing protein [Actinoplanes sp.]